jgi:hypothetical protein
VTALDALAHQQRDARATLIARLDEAGRLILDARMNARTGRPVSLEPARVKLVAAAEAREILDAITAAMNRAANRAEGSDQ